MSHLNILAVDDDEMNLEIISRTIRRAGHAFKGLSDGITAWEYLETHKDEVDIILLDKMMPMMNGIEVLRRIKNDPEMANIPVILQTGDVGTNEMQDGLAAGAYYYLTKPFYPQMLLALVNAAARDFISKDNVKRELRQERAAIDMLVDGTFSYKTLLEANILAAKIAYHADNPERIGAALSHLMINAIEHGNLGIGYEQKTKLLTAGHMEVTVEQLMKLPENAEKRVLVGFHRNEGEVLITIKDQGQGFASQKYMDFDPTRLTDPNGRGIATARIMGLSNLEYLGNGNKLRCSFKVRQAVKLDNILLNGAFS